MTATPQQHQRTQRDTQIITTSSTTDDVKDVRRRVCIDIPLCDLRHLRSLDNDDLDDVVNVVLDVDADFGWPFQSEWRGPHARLAVIVRPSSAQ